MQKQRVEFDVGLTRTNDLSADEKARLSRWYSEAHGTGTMDLVPFVPFLIENRPELLKRHRFVAESKTRVQAIGSLANVFIFLHYYTVVANREGILYEIIACHKWGATKEEVLDTIAFAYLHGGTQSLNAVAELSSEYLRAWEGSGRTVDGSPWPSQWAPDPGAFKAGLDPDTVELSKDEAERLNGWYTSVGSEVPAYVELLTRYRPTVMKEWRALQESTIASTLPKQIVPLYLLHLAIIQGNLPGIRFAARTAKAFGVEVDHIIDTVCWAMSCSGELVLQAVGKDLLDIVDGWAP